MLWTPSFGLYGRGLDSKINSEWTDYQAFSSPNLDNRIASELWNHPVQGLPRSTRSSKVLVVFLSPLPVAVGG